MSPRDFGVPLEFPGSFGGTRPGNRSPISALLHVSKFLRLCSNPLEGHLDAFFQLHLFSERELLPC